MSNLRFRVAAAIAIGSAPLAAQQPAPCRGPGAAFGVTAYECTTCGFRQKDFERAEYFFYAAPLVLHVKPTSQLRAGDIVEAVDGKPILTRAGGDLFTYPQIGQSEITVRRDGTRQKLTVTVKACEDAPGATNVPANAPPSTNSPTPSSNESGKPEPTGWFGFGLSCVPSCTLTKAADGTSYWKFDDYPPIAAIRAGSPAAVVGLKIGDVINEIDGKSILTEEGALRLMRAGSGQLPKIIVDGKELPVTMDVTVLRDGKRIRYLVQRP